MTEEKKELINKILELFRRYGIRSVTTNDIARELGISKKTLYEQFADKSEMIEQTLLLMYERLEASFKEVKDKKLGAIASLLEIYQQINEMMKYSSPNMEYDMRKYYPELFCRVFKNFNEIIYNIHVENMNQGKAEGVYREVNTDIIARLISHKAQMGLFDVFTIDELYSKKVHKEMFLYHLYGICNEKGHAMVKSQLNEFFTNTHI